MLLHDVLARWTPFRFCHGLSLYQLPPRMTQLLPQMTMAFDVDNAL